MRIIFTIIFLCCVQSHAQSLKTVFVANDSLSTNDVITAHKYAYENNEELEFDEIDVLPQYEHCINSTNEERLNCFKQGLGQHIFKNCDRELANSPDFPKEKFLFWIGFKVDHTGNVVDIVTNSPNEIIDKDVKRVFKLIPKMTPGYHNEKPVSVIYSLPLGY